MAMADVDLELLEAYLDAALDPAVAESLGRRLSVDPELSAMLEELRSQRAVRAAVWLSLEPDAASAERLVWQIRGKIAGEQSQGEVRPPALTRRWGAWQVARIGSAAAACVMLGFLVGWVGRGSRVPLAVSPGVESTQVAASGSIAVAATPVPMVPVADEYGRVVTFQQFKNTTDAKAFYEDLNRARGGGAFGAGHDDKIKLIDAPGERAAEKF